MSSVTITAMRRREGWMVTLPLGTFHGDYREGAISLEQHRAEHERYYKLIMSPGEYGRTPLRKRYRPLVRDGETFHHTEELRLLRDYVERPQLLNAIYLFALAATNDRSLIIPPRQREFVPPEQRRERFGLKTNICRGPEWTEAEDATLRRWFSVRTVGPYAGQHARLIPAEWDRVLAELGDRRTKGSVRSRIQDLNRKVLARYQINGYVSRDRLEKYMRELIGEKPRLPPLRVAKRRKASL